MSDRSAGLLGGAVFIIMAIWVAMGAVSLGTYNVPIQQGGATADYLVTNYVFVLLAFGFGALGAFFFYRAGQASVSSESLKKRREENDTKTSPPFLRE